MAGVQVDEIQVMNQEPERSEDYSARTQNKGIFRIRLMTVLMWVFSIGILVLSWLSFSLPAVEESLAGHITYLLFLVGVVGVFLAVVSVKAYRLASGVSSLSRDMEQSASQDPPAPVRAHPHPDLMLFVKHINSLMENLDIRHKSSLEALASNRLLARDMSHLLRIFDSVRHGAVATDLTGKIIFANQGMERYLDEAPVKVRGEMLREHLIPHDVLKVVAVREGEGQTAGLRTMNLPPDTKAGYGDTVVTSSLAYDDSNEVLGQLLLFEDVTQDVAEDKRHLEFVERMAQEMIVPLGKLEASAAEFKADIGDKQAMRTALNSQMRGLYGISRRAENFRDLSRLESGMVELYYSSTPFKQMLVDCINMVQSVADRKGIQLLADLPQRVPEDLPQLRIDNGLMCQAIGAVLENALLYTPSGGTVSLSTNSNERELMVTIQDTGVGMAKEEVGHIFERFYRASSSVADAVLGEVEGCGIGLTLAREILLLHGAEVHVASKLGTGTNVSVVLPRSLICKD